MARASELVDVILLYARFGGFEDEIRTATPCGCFNRWLRYTNVKLKVPIETQ